MSAVSVVPYGNEPQLAHVNDREHCGVGGSLLSASSNMCSGCNLPAVVMPYGPVY